MRAPTTAAFQFSLRIIGSVAGIVALIYFGNVLGSGKIGTYALTISIVVWMLLIADAGVVPAMSKRISEGTDQDKLFTAAFIMISGLVSVLITLIVLFSSRINNYVGMDVAAVVIFLLISNVLFILLTTSIKSHDRVATASIIRFIEQGLRPFLQVITILFGLGVSGLLYGYFGSLVVGCLFGILFLPNTLTIPGKQHFVSLIYFAKFSILGIVRSRAARWTDTVVLGFFVSKSLIGVYEIAWTIALSLILVTDSIGRTLFPKLSELASNDEADRISHFVEPALVFTGIIAIPGVVGGFILARDLLRLFGPSFTTGYMILPILLGWSLIVAYERILVNVIDALNRPKLTFHINLVHVFLNLVGNVMLVYFFGWIGAAIATTGAAVFSLGIAVIYINNLLNINYPFVPVAKQFLAAAVMGVVVYPLNQYMRGMPRESVLISIMVGATVYLIVLTVISHSIRNRILGMITPTISRLT